MNTIKFTNASPFAKEARVLLNDILTRTVMRRSFGGVPYQTTVQVPRTGSRTMYSTAIGFLVALVGFYFGAQLSASPPWLQVVSWIGLGFVIPGIGFNIMHDAGHGSFSSRRWVNELFSYSGNLVGVHVGFWKVKHNTVHHTFTNVVGYDDDIELYPLIRVDSSQRRYWFHRYQHIYVVPLYAFYLLFWVYILDFVRYSRRTIGEHQPIPKKHRNIYVFWGTKIFHVFAFPYVAYVSHGWFGVFGYLLALGIAGVVLTFVFQCAHLVSGVAISQTPVSDDYFEHQVRTTANFAPQSTILAWYIGGLNKQIEHHLFPNIAHVHYKDLSVGLKQLCRKHNLPYIESPNFISAILSHVRYLQKMGMNCA